jgi:thymidylate synthase
MLLERPQGPDPRGLRTSEVTGAIFRVGNLRPNILVNSGRDLNYRFMVAEFLWIALGRDDVEGIAKYNKEIGKFSDDGKVLYGSYGRRLILQWDRIHTVLKKDNHTRQAVGAIFNADMDPNTKDTPCTISLQWLLREGHLNCIATMRSSDIWLGLPYDFYVFSQLTNCLAGVLGVQTGWLQMQLGSLHLYETNAHKAMEAVAEWQSYTLESETTDGFPEFSMSKILDNPFDPAVVQLRGQEDIYAEVLQAQTKVQALGVLKRAYGKAYD